VRILYQHRTLADGAEGVHIAAMVDAFRALGHEVRVVGLAAGGAASPGPSLAARVKQSLPAALLELATLAVNAPEYAATAGEIARFKPDLLYKRHGRFDVAALAAARRAGVPAVLEVNCLFSQPPYVEFEPMTFLRLATAVERRALRQASLVVTVSSPLARLAHSLAGVDALVVPNGADISRFDRDAADPDRVRRRYALGNRLVVGWVGVLREWHGLELLLDAIAQLSDVHLLVVGDGPGRAALDRQAQAAGIADRVTVTGRIAHDEMPHFVAAMDIAVVADERTGVASPMKLLEYMAMGTAVIAPAMDNIRDVVTDRVDGLLFEAGSRQALLAAMRELRDDRALRASLGANARASVARDRTWTRIAERVLNRLQGTGAGHPDRARVT
jgi:glycosyltransferase involved in cell wall biosynthesis